MIHYRHSRPEERAALIAMANRVFSNPNHTVDFESMIPKVYAPDRETSALQYIALNDADQICGLIAMLPDRIHVGDDTLKCGFIGTVSVVPECRGQGIMIELMKRWEEEAREAGMDIMTLDGLRQRYQHYGYALGGQHYIFEINKADGVRYALKDVDVEDCCFRVLETGSEEEFLANRLHETQPFWHERALQADPWENHWHYQPAGFACTGRSYNNVPYVLLKNGQFAGYVTSNPERRELMEIRPADPADLDRMLKTWAAETDLRSFTVTVPAWDTATVRRLSAWSEWPSLCPAGQFRILNWQHVLEVMLGLKAKCSTLSDGSFGFSVENETFTITVRDGKPSVTKGAEAPLKLNVLEAENLFLSVFPTQSVAGLPADWFPLPFSNLVPDQF